LINIGKEPGAFVAGNGWSRDLITGSGWITRLTIGIATGILNGRRKPEGREAA